jgi:hypothetical protein
VANHDFCSPMPVIVCWLSAVSILGACTTNDQPASTGGLSEVASSKTESVQCGEGRLSRTALGDRFARLEWTACVGPATYEVYANGSRVWTTASTSGVVEVDSKASIEVVGVGSVQGPVRIGASAGVVPTSVSLGVGRSERAARSPVALGR